jgi:hypothetical protein
MSAVRKFWSFDMARLQWQNLCAALHPTQRRAERIDAHAGFGRQGQRLFEFFLVCLGRVPSPAPRQDMRARRQTGGASERLVRRAPEQRVGLPFYLGPILPKQRALDRIASKPEVVVAKGAFREQRLSGGQGGVGFIASVCRQGKQAMDDGFGFGVVAFFGVPIAFASSAMLRRRASIRSSSEGLLRADAPTPA